MPSLVSAWILSIFLSEKKHRDFSRYSPLVALLTKRNLKGPNNTDKRSCSALSIPRQLPSMSVQDRWFAEPLRLLSLPSSTFLKNQGGYPVLGKTHQNLIYRYMRLRFAPWILLTDVGPIPDVKDPSSPASTAVGSLSPNMALDAGLSDDPRSPTPAEAAAAGLASADTKKRDKDPVPHLSYMRHLQRNQPIRTAMERFGSGYQDYLQAPLQPLSDNLESVTYEVFEKDPVKYDWYERAINGALHDWIANQKPGSGPDSRVVVAVAGAGRGPLVTRALKAAVEAKATIELWAVEKNPNAYVLLQKRNQDSWAGQVMVIKSDMRSWKGPRRYGRQDASHGSLQDGLSEHDMLIDGEDDRGISYGKVDILISELLGSFGDNELSPECLDGAQHVLNPVHGISIPASYTAHLTPIAAPRLHAEIKLRSDTDPATPETPHVVMLHSYANLSTISSASHPLQPVIHQAWEFFHPVPSTALAVSSLRREGGLSGGSGGQMSNSEGSNEHNARVARLRFPCAWRGACDGLAGYFEAKLWGDVELSTRPDLIDQKSPDMISWFPIFFPLKVG